MTWEQGTAPSAAPRLSSGALQVSVERLVYEGYGLGHVLGPNGEPGEPLDDTRGTLLVPFALPGERVEVLASAGRESAELLRVLEPSPHRTAPGCPHFGVCGGCHVQMAIYPEQLRLKRHVLLDSLRRAGVADPPEPAVHAAEPWGYRNRIRLRLEGVADQRRFGYTERGSGQSFLPIVRCPIAAPLLWRAAETILATAKTCPELASWLAWTKEVELSTDAAETRLQGLLLCAVPGKGSPASPESFARAMRALHKGVPELAGAGAVRAQWRPLRLGEPLADWGAEGLPYQLGAECYWRTRGSFFQVNRFLLPELVELVCAGRSGALAWDLFAGVGLFSRVLARRFEQVTAVETHPGSARELQAALRRLGPQHHAEQRTTLEFLKSAVLQRERPDLIVLDPPRAGIGEESCGLLNRLATPELVYVSCDPVTLARDLALLQSAYEITALHLLDMFPQTYHQEAVVTLRRRS